MIRLICWLFGHSWRIIWGLYSGKPTGRRCRRCGLEDSTWLIR